MDRHTPLPRAVTVADAAELLSVSRWTVMRMIAAGSIHSTKIGRSRRIPTAEIARVLAVSSGYHESRRAG